VKLTKYNFISHAVTIRRCGHLHVRAVVPPQKQPPAPLEYEAAWTPQGRYRSFIKFKIIIEKDDENLLLAEK
jgi:hypothetical protein